MRAKNVLWTSLLIASLGFVGACTAKQKPAETTAQPPAEFPETTREAPPSEPPAIGLETIYFDYDQSVIRDDQRATLGNDAGAIKAGKFPKLTLAGHCDERGSEEYNLALGERRANAVKQYLVDSGVGGASLDTVSFGESQPAVQGHDESAWMRNRRVEFLKQQ